MTDHASVDIPWEWPASEWYVPENHGEAPSCFARSLAENLPITRGTTRLLDIGCGSGIIGIFALIDKGAKFVTFTDVLPSMIATTGANLVWHQREGRVQDCQFDFIRGKFTELPAEVVASHDIIVFNPPQFPSNLVELAERQRVLKNDTEKVYRFGLSGENADGLEVAREFVRWYANLSLSKPTAILNLSAFLGQSRIEEMLKYHAVDWEYIARTRVPLRRSLTGEADQFAMDAAERKDRSLQQAGEGWTKEIVTIKMTGGLRV